MPASWPCGLRLHSRCIQGCNGERGGEAHWLGLSALAGWPGLRVQDLLSSDHFPGQCGKFVHGKPGRLITVWPLYPPSLCSSPLHFFYD